MIPDSVVSFFHQNQDLLWLITLAHDLSITLLLYLLYGRQRLTDAIELAILLAT